MKYIDWSPLGLVKRVFSVKLVELRLNTTIIRGFDQILSDVCLSLLDYQEQIRKKKEESTKKQQQQEQNQQDECVNDETEHSEPIED